MSMDRQLTWTGEPLMYKRKAQGYGSIIGRYHHLYDAHGRIETIQPISRPVIMRLLTAIYGEGASTMAGLRLRVQSLEENKTKEDSDV